MSEMVERVARGMAKRNRGCDLWDEIADDGDTDYIGKNDYRDMACAAIEAMREPTEAMIAVMAGYDWTGTYDHLPITRPIEDDVADCWNYMIDEALK